MFPLNSSLGRVLMMSIVAALVLSGCVGRTIRSTMHGPQTTQIISNPPGAHIEANGEYIGDAPLTYSWPGKYRDGSEFADKMTIRASDAGRPIPPE